MRCHPKTGRKCLFPGDHASYTLGLPLAAGRAIVEALNARTVTPEIIYSHTWRAGDFVAWDNRCLLDRSMPDDTAGDPALYHARRGASLM